VPEEDTPLARQTGGGALTGEVSADAGRLDPRGAADAEAPRHPVEVQPRVIDGRDVEGEQTEPEPSVGRGHGDTAHDRDAVPDVGLEL
jgi:hypothetical protein